MLASIIYNYGKFCDDFKSTLKLGAYIYSVTAPDNFDGMETFGKLFFSDIHTFEKELHSEIEKIAIMDELPINWTYPEIQPKLLEEARKRGF